MTKGDKMKNLIVASLVICAAIGNTAIAYADDDEMGTRNWKDWDVTIGIGAEYEQVSPGIDKYESEVQPYVDIEYKDIYFIKSQYGIGAYFLKLDEDKDAMDLEIGFAIGYDFGREETDAQKELDGLGDVKGSAEAVMFVETEIGPTELEFELAKGLGSKGHNGIHGEFEAGLDGMVTRNIFLSAGAFLTYGNSKYLQSYYGITAEQASNSSTYSATYKPGSGLESYGVGFDAQYMLNKNWSLFGMTEYTRLAGDAKDSPIAKDDSFFSSTLGVSYTF